MWVCDAKCAWWSWCSIAILIHHVLCTAAVLKQLAQWCCLCIAQYTLMHITCHTYVPVACWDVCRDHVQVCLCGAMHIVKQPLLWTCHFHCCEVRREARCFKSDVMAYTSHQSVNNIQFNNTMYYIVHNMFHKFIKWIVWLFIFKYVCLFPNRVCLNIDFQNLQLLLQ